ncbi:MAG: hypothetical protein K0M40_05110 [Prolixibacteraceae bacterium]|nr:hypothetical protein [Prolixibacteraceae bacterium]
MKAKNNMSGITLGSLLRTISIAAIFIGIFSCGNRAAGDKSKTTSDSTVVSVEEPDESGDLQIVNAILVSPENPRPGQIFRVMVTGSKSIRKAKITVNSPSGEIETAKSRGGEGLPFWRIDEFVAGTEGEYRITLKTRNTTEQLDFLVTEKPAISASKAVWKTKKGWDSKAEALYSAWVNALFQGADERSSWGALNEITQSQELNFLYNHLSLGEDDANGKVKVLMEPDCADNPFFLRAYFAWKLGLPFGYHLSDRGGLGRSPKTGQWKTNEAILSKSDPTQKFNAFMRMVANGVHSGTARTSLSNENSDYYLVALSREAIRPGIVYADPYGHTLILVGQVPQTDDNPGVLLSVDAQPDGTVGIKRFWKGNFLFNTNEKEVIGEPGFKSFRPIVVTDGKLRLLKTEEIIPESGLLPFSIQQKGMESNAFYHEMEQIINPEPLDPEMAMLDLIKALHEQLVVRVTSVENGEKYMKAHPGTVIPMPGRAAGVFQTGGVWEDFSTPNRDLRLLIAMDAVLDFPDKVMRSPDDYKIPMLQSPEKVKGNLQELMNKKLTELSITYTRSNGTEQVLTISELLKRRDAFEMAYNPNDGAEIRWGAPENSEERSTCKRRVPASQLEKMKSVRIWFQKRLHPPT